MIFEVVHGCFGYGDGREVLRDESVPGHGLVAQHLAPRRRTRGALVADRGAVRQRATDAGRIVA